MNLDAGSASSRGRPRDPDLEDRVFDTAIALYAEGGWRAFTFEAIARRSGVGKSSLYRRWSSRAELLTATFEARWLRVHEIDTGTLKGDLTELAQMIFDNITGEHSGVQSWSRIDALQHPEVRLAVAPYSEAAILQGRAIVRRAARRNEVPESLNPGLLMDLVVGAVNNHVSTTPQQLVAAMVKKRGSFVRSLIDAVLKGVGAADPLTNR
jgi:AcrR family transcriptional regulator